MMRRENEIKSSR